MANEKKPKKPRNKEQSAQARKSKFVKHYVATDNAKAAALKAGYKPTAAACLGSRLLTEPDVRKSIAEERAKIFDKLGITAERVMAELAALAFSTPKDATRWNDSGVTLYDSDNVSDQAAAAIKKVSYKYSDGAGHVSLELHDKKPALEALARMMGIDGKDEEAKQSPTVTINLGGVTHGSITID